MGAIYLIECHRKCTLIYKKETEFFRTDIAAVALYSGGKDKEFLFHSCVHAVNHEN